MVNYYPKILNRTLVVLSNFYLGRYKRDPGRLKVIFDEIWRVLTPEGEVRIFPVQLDKRPGFIDSLKRTSLVKDNNRGKFQVIDSHQKHDGLDDNTLILKKRGSLKHSEKK